MAHGTVAAASADDAARPRFPPRSAHRHDPDDAAGLLSWRVFWLLILLRARYKRFATRAPLEFLVATRNALQFLPSGNCLRECSFARRATARERYQTKSNNWRGSNVSTRRG